MIKESKPQKLKRLQVERTKLELGLRDALLAEKLAQSERKKLKLKLKINTSETEAMKERDIVISEHAMLRYLERCLGLDLEQVQADMLSVDTKVLIKKLGDGKYPTAEGCKAIVKNNTVVSVV